MASPARDHFQRTTAAGAAVAAPAPAAGGLGARMLAMLRAHQAALKGIKSVKAKIAAKATYLPEYAAYIRGLLDAGTAAGADAELLLTVLVWRFDVADWVGAMDIARLACKLKLATPERFARDLPCLLVEEIAEAILDAAKAAREIDGRAETALDEAMELTAGADMPDEVRAKGWKALGLAAKDRDPAAALRHLRAALDHDSTCGIKTEIARLEKALAAPGDTSTEPAVLSPPAA